MNKITESEICAVLTRGSGVCQGKFRIYEQFRKSKSVNENIKFLKNEYGIGGCYPAVSGTKIHEDHDGRGIKIMRGEIMKPEAEILLSWDQVEKRISALIKAKKYLNEKEKAELPNYEMRQAEKEDRDEIRDKFIRIIDDYNKKAANDDEIKKWHALSAANAYVSGDEYYFSNHGNGDDAIDRMIKFMRQTAKHKELESRSNEIIKALGGEEEKTEDTEIEFSLFDLFSTSGQLALFDF